MPTVWVLAPPEMYGEARADEMLVFSTREKAIDFLRQHAGRTWPGPEPIKPVWDEEQVQRLVAPWVLPHAIEAHYQNYRRLYEQELAYYHQKLTRLESIMAQGFDAWFEEWLAKWYSDGDLAEVEVQ